MKSETSMKLGDLVQDRITGFKGVIIARTDWLNGCVRMLLQSKELKDGKPIDSVTFDVEQLEVLAENSHPVGTPGGGWMPDPVR